MILLRSVEERDLDALEHFAQIPGMFNLPSDRDLLRERLLRSVDSFAGKITDLPETKYIFVAEDTATGNVVATSMIAGQHGTKDSPHFYFQISQEQKYSQTINTGFIHGTLELKQDTDGPSEIGGLVVDPAFRGGEVRLGRQVSFVRFLYLAMYPTRFRPKVIAELLPPLNKKGLSPLWEAIGRRFTNMDYWEADQLCAKNKEFILSLFPSGKIYTTFLSAEARNALGKVGKDTQPVMHMLQKIGFAYKNQVDPFDGGPHLWANVSDIKPVKNFISGKWGGSTASVAGSNAASGLLSNPAPAVAEGFRAVSAECHVHDNQITVTDSRQATEIETLLRLKRGDSLCFMPYYGDVASRQVPSSA